MSNDYEAVKICSCSLDFQHGHPIEFGCSCEISCIDEEEEEEENICFCLAQHTCYYNHGGLLSLDEVSEPIYECNECCSCDKSCINRVVQNGASIEFNVVDFHLKGQGLTSTEYIKEGTFVIEYIGKRITEVEAKAQLESKCHSDCYLYVLVEHFGETERSFYIDARETGNLARFINHSCQPNLEMVPVRVNSQDPHFAFFASKDIPTGTELTFSYGRTNILNSERKLKKCLCGSPKCSGFLPFTALRVI